mmetsp:Transcript_36884/g.119013  ORF Transcript_36884/g.119013 Transcript_36884/m.119013 type:complete len:248 (+) Transcript_36884:220-963(+)
MHRGSDKKHCWHRCADASCRRRAPHRLWSHSRGGDRSRGASPSPLRCPQRVELPSDRPCLRRDRATLVRRRLDLHPRPTARGLARRRLAPALLHSSDRLRHRHRGHRHRPARRALRAPGSGRLEDSGPLRLRRLRPHAALPPPLPRTPRHGVILWSRWCPRHRPLHDRPPRRRVVRCHRRRRAGGRRRRSSRGGRRRSRRRWRRARLAPFGRRHRLLRLSRLKCLPRALQRSFRPHGPGAAAGGAGR